MWSRRTAVIFGALVLALGSVLVAAQAVAQEAAPQPPPAPQVESPGSAPSPNSVWISGHWQWRGGKYEWVPGRWETAPPGASYVPGRHKKTGEGWVWEPGRWRQVGAAR